MNIYNVFLQRHWTDGECRDNYAQDSDFLG